METQERAHSSQVSPNTKRMAENSTDRLFRSIVCIPDLPRVLLVSSTLYSTEALATAVQAGVVPSVVSRRFSQKAALFQSKPRHRGQPLRVLSQECRNRKYAITLKHAVHPTGVNSCAKSSIFVAPKLAKKSFANELQPIHVKRYSYPHTHVDPISRRRAASR